VEATRIGALNFLEKPISLQKLLKAVQQGLSRSVESVRPVNFQMRSVVPQVETTRIVQDTNYATTTTMHAPSTMSPITMLPQETQLFSLSFDLPLREARDAFERAYFEHHLTREGGSMTRVAEKTGLERTHLYRKLKQLGVEPGKLSKKGG
jgi:DNA-binding NtrC family response regulator